MMMMGENKKDFQIKHELGNEYKSMVWKLNEILSLINARKEDTSFRNNEYRNLLELEINVNESIRSLIRCEMDLIDNDLY